MSKSLTMMLRETHGMEPECDAEAKAIEAELQTIKNTVKERLRTVSLPHCAGEESTRKLLVALVDEPE